MWAGIYAFEDNRLMLHISNNNKFSNNNSFACS